MSGFPTVDGRNPAKTAAAATTTTTTTTMMTTTTFTSALKYMFLLQGSFTTNAISMETPSPSCNKKTTSFSAPWRPIFHPLPSRRGFGPRFPTSFRWNLHFQSYWRLDSTWTKGGSVVQRIQRGEFLLVGRSPKLVGVFLLASTSLLGNHGCNEKNTTKKWEARATLRPSRFSNIFGYILRCRP